MTVTKNDVLSFLGLPVNPFSICSTHQVFFPHPSHKNVCKDITKGIAQRVGLILLTGVAGIGKTAVITAVSHSLHTNVHCIFLRYGNFRFSELVDYICSELAITENENESKLDALSRFLTDQYQQGNNVVLFLDDFNCLDYEIISGLKALSVSPGSNEHTIQTVLVGLPVVEEILASNDSDSTALNCHLTPLSEHEVGPYVKYHLDCAGFEGKNPFKREAIQQIGQLSRGIPAKINLLCNAAIVIAKYENRKMISSDVVMKALKLTLLPSFTNDDYIDVDLDHVFENTQVNQFIRSTGKENCFDLNTELINPNLMVPKLDSKGNNLAKEKSGLFGYLKNLPDCISHNRFEVFPRSVAAMTGFIGVLVILVGLIGSQHGAIQRFLDGELIYSNQSLFDAVTRGDVDAVASMVSAGADINQTDPSGNSLLLLAVANENTELVTFFIAHSANVNVQNQKGDTALMYAAWSGQIATVEKILGQSVDVNQKNKRGQTALMNASSDGHLQIVAALLETPVDVDAVDDNGNSSFMLSAANGHYGVVQRLRDENINVDKQNRQGWTALMFAAWGGYTEIVNLLIASGANVFIENRDYISASELASVQGHREIVTLLKNAKVHSGISLPN